MGDKSPLKYEYWSTAKSFKGFLPASLPIEIADFNLGFWPSSRIQLWVDGELKQNSMLTNMIYTPRQFLASYFNRTKRDEIPKGSLLICGTPAGIAFKVSSFKKFMADFLGFTPFTKLKLAARSELDKNKYLRSGSKVLVKIENIGQSEITIN